MDAFSERSFAKRKDTTTTWSEWLDMHTIVPGDEASNYYGFQEIQLEMLRKNEEPCDAPGQTTESISEPPEPEATPHAVMAGGIASLRRQELVTVAGGRP